MNRSVDFSTLPNAGLFRRLSALAYDALLMAAIVIGIGIAVVIVRVIFAGAPAEGESMQPLPFWLITPAIWATLSSYYYFCWQKRGQTLAMKTWRLRVQQADGSLLTKQQCIYRALLAPLSTLSIIGLLWCLFDKQNGCLHDRLSKTYMVLLPKKVN